MVLTYVSVHYLRQWVGGEGDTAGRDEDDVRN